eukprot:11218799-Lingulodinium_polyedra.AAC.1
MNSRSSLLMAWVLAVASPLPALIILDGLDELPGAGHLGDEHVLELEGVRKGLVQRALLVRLGLL